MNSRACNPCNHITLAEFFKTQDSLAWVLFTSNDDPEDFDYRYEDYARQGDESDWNLALRRIRLAMVELGHIDQATSNAWAQDEPQHTFTSNEV